MVGLSGFIIKRKTLFVLDSPFPSLDQAKKYFTFDVHACSMLACTQSQKKSFESKKYSSGSYCKSYEEIF